MTKRYDLHCHSTCSDGTLTPTELVSRAADRGVNVLALTDHDTVAGLAEARTEAHSRQMDLINGVEISALWNKQTIHIVGLQVDPDNPVLLSGLDRIAVERIRRAKKIAERMEHCGVEDCWRLAVEMAGTEAVTRTHFARILLESGTVNSMDKAFRHWLGRKGKAYVAGHWAPMEDAVKWIRAAGGQAVIAHPGRYKLSRTKMKRLFTEFKQAGGVAVEIACSSQHDQQRTNIAAIASELELLASAGSDFHTPGIYGIELGFNLNLPYNCDPIWTTWS